MPSHEVDLVVFELGGRTWAADALDLVRVGSDGGPARTGTAKGRRSLVVRDAEEEIQVPIDRLRGFERVPVSALRPMPAFARSLASPALVGAWLAPEEIVLLIDLQALVKESLSLHQPQPIQGPPWTTPT